MIELIFVVVLILVISAACSLFEAVLYSVPASRIESLERAGRPVGRLLKQMRRQVDQPIAAVLSLNTIANTGGCAIAGAMAANVLGTSRIGYFSVVFTLAILLLSEVLPKTVGVVYARGLAPFIAYPLRALVVVFRPFVMLTQLTTKLVWTGHHEQRVSDDELLAMVGLGLRSGDLKADEARVIRNVLSFETRTAAEVMTPRPVVFTMGTDVTVREAVDLVELNRFSRVPVYDEDPEELVGIAHKLDILKAVANDEFGTTVADLMRPIHFVVDTASLDQLMRTFLERRQHMVAVIDEFGGFEGIVTLEDVLEELIGREIVDEFDQITDLRAFARQRRKETLSQRGEMS